ncbi:MAG: hypothetical protein ACJAS9_001791 [Polaribacter sp.]|jgi:hypothetical protein
MVAIPREKMSRFTAPLTPSTSVGVVEGFSLIFFGVFRLTQFDPKLKVEAACATVSEVTKETFEVYFKIE